jgi:hypothetical protein
MPTADHALFGPPHSLVGMLGSAAVVVWLWRSGRLTATAEAWRRETTSPTSPTLPTLPPPPPSTPAPPAPPSNAS